MTERGTAPFASLTKGKIVVASSDGYRSFPTLEPTPR